MSGFEQFPLLHRAMSRIRSHYLSRGQDPDALAAAATATFERLLAVLFPILGQAGSLALFRRSLNLTEAAFPGYRAARAVEDTNLLQVASSCLRREPEIVEAAIALLQTFVELLATFIGDRLTQQLLQDAWPDILPTPSEENQQ